METLKSALIGYTGFVGSNILTQQPFDFLYNSKNIEEIQGQNFGLVVCAGAPGTKWIANKNPEADLISIQKLMDNLKHVQCEKFVLISTVDVYNPVNGVNEDSEVSKESLQPYGKHRRILEEFAENRFDSLIVRLPGVFGQGLKKNVIYDLKHGSALNIHPDSTLQFYWLNNIWADIQKALTNKLKTINIATEPIQLKELAEKIFDINLAPQKKTTPVYYDMQTKYAPIWGLDKQYLYLKDKVLGDLRAFTNQP